jgi:hypothetical protein
MYMIQQLTLPEPIEWPEWEAITPEDMPEPRFPEAWTRADKKRGLFLQRLTMNGRYRESRYCPSSNTAFILRDGERVVTGYFEDRSGIYFYKPGVENFRHSLTDFTFLIVGTAFPLNTFLKKETGLDWPEQMIAPDDPWLPRIFFLIMSDYMAFSKSGPYWVPDPESVLDMRHKSRPRTLTYCYPPPLGDVAAELTNPLLPEFMAAHDGWIQEPYDSLTPGDPCWETVIANFRRYT